MALRQRYLQAAIAAALMLSPPTFADDAPVAPVDPTALISADAGGMPTLEDPAASLPAAAQPDAIAEAPAAPIDPQQRAAWMDMIRIEHGNGLDSEGKRFGDADLRLVTRSDMGVATLAKINIFALAAVGARKARGFSKDALQGDTIEGISSPAVAHLPGMLQQRLAAYFHAHPDALPGHPVTVRADPRLWALTYEQLTGSQVPYQLKHNATITILPEKGPATLNVDCIDGTQTAPLAQWQADDYAQVRSVAKELAEQCVERFAARLPEAFPSAIAAGPATTPRQAPAGKSRIRIFGANGRGITMYVGGQCRADPRSRKIVVARSTGAAIGSLFSGTPDNLSIGMPQTAAVRDMKSVLVSKPYYQEYSVDAGRPLIFDAQIENSAELRCRKVVSMQFVPQSGQDYEVALNVVNNMCVLYSTQVAADGAVQLNPVQAPADCPAP